MFKQDSSYENGIDIVGKNIREDSAGLPSSSDVFFWCGV